MLYMTAVLNLSLSFKLFSSRPEIENSLASPCHEVRSWDAPPEFDKWHVGDGSCTDEGRHQQVLGVGVLVDGQHHQVARDQGHQDGDGKPDLERRFMSILWFFGFSATSLSP